MSMCLILYVYSISYRWQSSVLLWGCSRSHPTWTSEGWAVAGSQTTGSTSHANTPCPGTPGNTWVAPWITVSSLFVPLVYSSGRESQQFVSLNLTCKIFSASSSSFADWTLDFSVSYCRMAAAPKEQPVNWHGVSYQPSYFPKPQYCLHLLYFLLF